ncbi:MAG: YkgJ family cysteine cluster protein [Thermoguttaceae bacterium]
MSTTPWYHAGLRFRCTQCGNCCTGAPGYVWVNKEEIASLATLLKLDVEEFEKRYVRRVGIRKSLVEFPNGDCVFFHSESRTCHVYEGRPRQCRTWPFWNSNLASPEAWEQAAERCPGCNRGKLVTLDKIEEQRNEMSL